MMRKILSAIYFLFFFVWSLSARDTVTVMHYNLLYYGFYTSFCNSQNNNVNQKDQYLTTIINFVEPDIFTVNELGRGQENVDRILDNVLNTDSQNRFRAATYTNTTNSPIVNMLFYDHHKFRLYYEAVVANVVRDINLYTLYYNDEEMLAAGDTIFLTAIVAHFKAGSSAMEQQTRTSEAQAVMAYLNSTGIRGNLLFLGDFNMKSSFEQAFQHITFHPNEEIRFYDPVNKPGTWYKNPQMAPFHTQSTRTESHDCFASGGLDDRYDFILASRSIMQGDLGLQYIEGSYRTLGQDGNRFRQSLISPPNHSAPPDVIEALYGMSDHLPVILQLKTSRISLSNKTLQEAIPQIRYNNPVADILKITIERTAHPVYISLFSIAGQKYISGQEIPQGDSFSFDFSGFPSGIYFFRLESPGFSPVTHKIVKL